MSGLAGMTREEVGVALWRAVDFEPSRVGDINVLADAMLVLLDQTCADALELRMRPIRALCEDAEADARDPLAGLVAVADIRRVIDQDGP